MMVSKLRARKADQVKFSLKNSGRFSSDQGAIWNQVERMAMQRDAVSRSMAMSEIYRKETSSLEKYVEHFDLTDSQVDAVYMINGKVAGRRIFNYG